jgi:copper chaperone CopZ
MAERNLSIAIGGMSCDGCVASVTRVLSRVPGVRIVKVAVGSAQVAAEDRVADADLAAAIAKAGFEAGSVTTS